MIEKNIFTTEKGEFDRRIYPSDWRFSATIVGMLRYFRELNINHFYDNIHLYYNYTDISVDSDEFYFAYVERTYNSKMHHLEAERILVETELDPDKKKLLKDKLNGNVVMKSVFSKIDLEDKQLIIDLINENRINLIKETYKNAKTGYAKYCNNNKFRTESDIICRLNGYYVDTGRKTKSLSYGFDDSARNYSDEIEFDFIPFAFTDEREAIFVNNNFSIELLINTNNNIIRLLSENIGESFRQKLFYSISEGSDFIDYDVEIIIKEQDVDYFTTLFIRKEAIDIFKRIKNLESFGNIQKALKYNVKITDDYYIRIMDVVTDSILNLRVLDDLINRMLKMGNGFLVSQLIRINRIIYEKIFKKEGNMKYFGGYKNVTDSANSVKAYLIRKNSQKKIDSYRNKLLNSLIANDKDRFVEVMLQLSSYTETPFAFLHDLISRWDLDKNLAYDFVNQLNYFDLKTDKKGERIDE